MGGPLGWVLFKYLVNEIPTGVGEEQACGFQTLAVFYMNSRWQKLFSMECKGVTEKKLRGLKSINLFHNFRGQVQFSFCSMTLYILPAWG